MNNEGQELYPTLRYRRYGSLQAVEVIDRMTEAGMAEVDAKHPSDRSRKRKNGERANRKCKKGYAIAITKERLS